MAELLAGDAGGAGSTRISADTSGRRGRDDGWLAVFFEFWAHVIRHPELRGRFAEHPPARAGRRSPARSSGSRPSAASSCPIAALPLAVASGAMQIGLALERLTQPEVVDEALGAAHGPAAAGRDREGEGDEARIRPPPDRLVRRAAQASQGASRRRSASPPRELARAAAAAARARCSPTRASTRRSSASGSRPGRSRSSACPCSTRPR